MATFGDPNWNSVAMTMVFNRCTMEEAEIALGLRKPKESPAAPTDKGTSTSEPKKSAT